MNFWRKGRARPCVAMIAAYALALQALLGAVAIGQAAGADPFVICHTGGNGAPDNGGNSQAGHDCQLCTLTHAAFALPDGAQPEAAYEFVAIAAIAPRAVDGIVSFDSAGGHYPRGPPGIFAG